MDLRTIDLRPGANAFPLAWFDDPGLTRITHPHIGADGRIIGHFARWPLNRWEQGPPRSATGYASFQRHDLTTCGTTLRVGLIADTPRNAPMNSGSEDVDALDRPIAAAVRVGEDAHGIWVAGAAAPYVGETCTHRERLHVSGHWARQDDGSMELIDLILVDGPAYLNRNIWAPESGTS
jgi:hypothetical protein